MFPRVTPDDVSHLSLLMASVSVDNWEKNIDSKILSVFAADFNYPDMQHCDSYDTEFSRALELRGKVNKLSVSLSSTHTFDDNSLFYFSQPIISHWDEFERILKMVIVAKEIEYVEAKLAVTHVSQATYVSKEFMSKLWIVSEKFDEGAIE